MNYSINNQPTQLLFIDATVDDIETLLQGTLPGIEAHILSGEQDGVAQITQILQQHPEVNTVHIVSHGSPGCLYLGDSQLCLDNLNMYTSQLQSWAREGLNLLLYGCNVAAGDAGEEFVNKLHSLTGANIAASATLTGNVSLGGNWNLEFSKGDAKQTLAFTSNTVEIYSHVLATTIFSETFANNNAGWTLGPEWQIGSATASSGGTGNPDPSVDNTPTGDNGIAGVVIGGNASTALHGYYYITSPVINTNVTGNLNFDYYRWLNSDYTPFMQNTVEVFNGSSWIPLWTTGPSPAVWDNAWTKQSFDITAYKSSSTQVRFGFQIGSTGVWTIGSWNIDDVKISYNNPPNLTTPAIISFIDTTNEDTFTSQIGTLSATDQDGDTLTYGITGGTANGTTVTKTGAYGTLSLNSSTGAYTFTPVDSAIEKLTSNATEGFTVTVSDGTATDSKTLAINLTGANDTPIVNSATFSILENTANGTVVGTVTGSDIENSPLSNWTIAGGNTDVDGDGQFAFAINATTGQITVNDSGDLDFETQSQFNLQVTTSDGSATSNPANVTVTLLNVQEFTPGNDVGKGTSGDDTMDAKDGDDRIFGYDGSDTIFAGTGVDIAYGGNGNDTIYGGDGNDRLYGDAGNDTLLGDAGNDILYGGAGDDLLNGGLGNDRYYGDAGIDTFVIGVGQGVDSIYGYQKGIDKIQVLGGISVVEEKSGSNLLITAVTETGTEILATVYNALPGQVSYI